MNKLISIFTFLLILTTSCHQPINPNKERYVKKLDTVYKPNSFDIDYVTRTFYNNSEDLYSNKKYGHTSYLKQVVGQNEITFSWSEIENKKFIESGASYVNFKNESEFFRFLNLVDTLHKNLDKSLKFEFDENGLITLETGVSNKEVILNHRSIVSSIDNGRYGLTKNEIDSIRRIYSKYKSE